MDQHTSGAVVPLEHSKQSLATLPISKPLTLPDTLRLFGRLATVFGDAKIIDERQRKLLAMEWVEALGSWGFEKVNTAVSAVIKTSKFWPSIAEVEEALRAQLPPPAREYQPKEPPPVFCRDNRTEAEEIAYRTAELLKMKRQWSYTTSTEREDGDQALASKPASDGPITQAVLNSCAGRRARKLPTCESSCARRDCELRQREAQ